MAHLCSCCAICVLAPTYLMFFLQRKCKPVDDTPKNLKQLSNAVVPLCLIYEAVEDVIDRLPNVRSVDHELAVYAVKNSLQIVAFTRVLRVEELEQLQHKRVVDVLLPDFGVDLVGNHISQQEFVHDLCVK